MTCVKFFMLILLAASVIGSPMPILDLILDDLLKGAENGQAGSNTQNQLLGSGSQNVLAGSGAQNALQSSALPNQLAGTDPQVLPGDLARGFSFTDFLKLLSDREALRRGMESLLSAAGSNSPGSNSSLNPIANLGGFSRYDFLRALRGLRPDAAPIAGAATAAGAGAVARRGTPAGTGAVAGTGIGTGTATGTGTGADALLNSLDTDLLNTLSNADLLEGLPANSPELTSLINSLQGIPGSDILGDLPTGNLLQGLSAADLLKISLGVDLLQGLQGTDLLNGLPGIDALNDIPGGDRLRQLLSGDLLNLGLGADLLNGTPGRDLLGLSGFSNAAGLYNARGTLDIPGTSAVPTTVL